MNKFVEMKAYKINVNVCVSIKIKTLIRIKKTLSNNHRIKSTNNELNYYFDIKNIPNEC